MSEAWQQFGFLTRLRGGRSTHVPCNSTRRPGNCSLRLHALCLVCRMHLRHDCLVCTLLPAGDDDGSACVCRQRLTTLQLTLLRAMPSSAAVSRGSLRRRSFTSSALIRAHPFPPSSSASGVQFSTSSLPVAKKSPHPPVTRDRLFSQANRVQLATGVACHVHVCCHVIIMPARRNLYGSS